MSRVFQPHSQTFLLLSALCMSASVAFSPVKAQNTATLQKFEKEKHLGTIEQAVVGIEVTTISEDGSQKQIRRGNGLMLRCDGFVLAPTALFAYSLPTASFARQSVSVTLFPGTAKAQKVVAHGPHLRGVLQKYNMRYVVFKVDNVHVPTLKPVLPDTLKLGEALQVVWSAWNEQEAAFGPVQKKPAILGALPKTEAERKALGAGGLALSEAPQGVPLGAIIVGPEQRAVGLNTSHSEAAGTQGFTSMSVLAEATNAVTALPCTDAAFRALTLASGKDVSFGAGAFPAATPRTPNTPALGKSSEISAIPEENELAESWPGMVQVPGGPIAVPSAILKIQPDMEGATVACVAPFQIDKYEVTNRQYLAFWKSLPVKQQLPEYWPLGWAVSGTPFPEQIADFPVIGVHLTGALAYAKSVGKRLPTPYEWCLAAFGPKGETELLPWVKEYMADRNKAADRIEQAHVQFLKDNPLLIHTSDFLHAMPPDVPSETPDAANYRYHLRHFPGADLATPWFGQPQIENYKRIDLLDVLRGAQVDAGLMEISDWSRRTIEAEAEKVWAKWHSPLSLDAVGSHNLDVSPYGAQDMIMNAEELIAPYPAWAANANERAIHFWWIPPLVGIRKYSTFKPFLQVYFHAEVAPLARLIQRTGKYPYADLILTTANLYETLALVNPVERWKIDVRQEYILRIPIWGDDHTFNNGLHRFRAGLAVWHQKPVHFHTESGLPVPLNDLGQLPVKEVGSGELVYLLPRGFRCAR